MRQLFVLLSRIILKNKIIILLLWILLLILSILILTFNKNSTYETDLKGLEYTEAFQVNKIIEERFNFKNGVSSAVVVQDQKDSKDLEADLMKTFPQILLVSEVKSNKAHKNKLLFIQFKPDKRFIDMQALTDDIRGLLRKWTAKTGRKTYLTGNTSFHYDSDQAGKQDSKTSESFALLISLVILIYNFGALFSAFLPLLIGATTIIYLNALLKFLGMGTNTLSLILTGLVGLALAIDYSLFIVSRFREEVNQGNNDEVSLEKTYKFSAKTIFVSALIMLCSISALMMPDVSTSRVVVINLFIVIIISLFNSIIILPALLVFGKNFLNKPEFLARIISKRNNYHYWKQFATHIVNYPKTYFLISLLILLGLSLPVHSLKLWEAVQTVAPQNSESMDGYKLLENDNWGGELIPVNIVIKAPAGQTVYNPELISFIYDFTRTLEKNPNVESVQSITSWNKAFSKNDYNTFFNSIYTFNLLTQQNQFSGLVNSGSGNDITIINVFPKRLMDLQDTYEILKFVDKYEKEQNKFEILSGGTVARARDFTRELYGHVPQMLMIIFGGIYLILFFYMRSVILPLKAGIMNFLPILSAFGILTMVFQFGLFNNFLQVTPNGAIINMVPIILFCIIFGLSMDYEVLILSRITEAYENTGDVREAIIEGLAKSGSVITGAVLILFGVFLPGIFSSSPISKQICIGIASAILIDATIVRLFLVPSFMMLMGHWNWWNPFKNLKK
jgi:RND superfamily putative drug exporter